ncbi:hypothetical protein LCL89_11420 [Halobacillus yeomjeoni]|uniref:Uncharacterized protein n=1 Tax=Halobacillus yeomjeoni TaxID=311194 RepID=A0A931HWV5_9BACI|nr:hypothetical protein [Halobacillus yeomjeoni]MBH0230904.1 hypothetical protein [Halobacillus yeomjeoni]MCA0984654.1 hypothetical protein [Halobacillus yeomjeoni]
MMWLLLTIPVSLIALAVYFERRGRRQAERDHLTMKDHQVLQEDYITHGAGNQSTKPEHL